MVRKPSFYAKRCPSLEQKIRMGNEPLYRKRTKYAKSGKKFNFSYSKIKNIKTFLTRRARLKAPSSDKITRRLKDEHSTKE